MYIRRPLSGFVFGHTSRGILRQVVAEDLKEKGRASLRQDLEIEEHYQRIQASPSNHSHSHTQSIPISHSQYYHRTPYSRCFFCCAFHIFLLLIILRIFANADQGEHDRSQ